MDDNRYVIYDVDKVSFAITKDIAHQSVLWGLDISGLSENENGLTIVSKTPIDGLIRGTICDISVFARTRNVCDGTKRNLCDWQWRDMLCSRVMHCQEEDKPGVDVIYRFID